MKNDYASRFDRLVDIKDVRRYCIYAFAFLGIIGEENEPYGLDPYDIDELRKSLHNYFAVALGVNRDVIKDLWISVEEDYYSARIERSFPSIVNDFHTKLKEKYNEIWKRIMSMPVISDTKLCETDNSVVSSNEFEIDQIPSLS